MNSEAFLAKFMAGMKEDRNFKRPPPTPQTDAKPI